MLSIALPLFIKLSAGFVEVMLLSAMALVPICFIVYAVDCEGPSIIALAAFLVVTVT